MKVSICVGSSCHIKGSHAVITKIQQLIQQYHLENEVELCASFCMGNCAQGVSMMVDQELISNANEDTIQSIFEEKILPQIRK